jgi:hypothetical protein
VLLRDSISLSPSVKARRLIEAKIFKEEILNTLKKRLGVKRMWRGC